MVRLTGIALCAALISVDSVLGDVYLHAPRGSNNRNCRIDNSTQRRNGQRLYDSQNNDKGGYSCPRAYPFACYAKYDPNLETQTPRAECNALNSPDIPDKNNDPEGFAEVEAQYKAMVNEEGVLHPDAVNTPMQYYYAGTELSMEWTNQHGMGTNNKLHSNVIIQYACVEDLQDNCGIENEEDDIEDTEPPTTAETEEGTSDEPVAVNMCKPRVDVKRKLCKPRDGFPVNNGVVNNQRRNSEATDRIDPGVIYQDDYRYGRHEGNEYRNECFSRQRNKGLYTADQDLNGDTARYTRQNPNGTPYGLECAEEAVYWPYWHHSPWKDVAVITSNVTHCELMAQESQNVQMKGRCDMTGADNPPNDTPNNERSCIESGGNWCMDPSHNLSPPECIEGAYNRQNHLGNVGGGTNTNQFNWTIPDALVGQQCVLRVRYNISTGDYGSISVFGDSQQNGDELSPLKDRNNNEVQSYRQLADDGDDVPGAMLGFAVNTNQAGRTFQDRTYMFEVKERPSNRCHNTIHNLQTRGKRGNIVQTYPSVEYDFAPQILTTYEGDCVHVQFIGSDYNPNRNPNNGEGGPPRVDDENQHKSDRHNLVQTDETRANSYVRMDVSSWDMFKAPKEDLLRLAFVGQDIENSEVCKSPSAIQELGLANRNQREGTHYNCAKLSGVKLPYFDAGLFEVGAAGKYTFMSTRNNNFSNRGQKGELHVLPRMSAVAIAGAAAGGVLVVAGVGAAWFYGIGAGLVAGIGSGVLRQRQRQTLNKPASPVPTSGGVLSSVIAIYDHEATEEGELDFKIGDRISVVKKDPSGWWEGFKQTGERGVFPKNYVEESK